MLRLQQSNDDFAYQDATVGNFRNSVEDPPNLEGGSSSGSSTLEGTESPTFKDVYEDMPVLYDGHTLRPLILIIGFVMLNIFYTVFHINFTTFELFVFADRCGLVFVANLPLFYLLAAKTQPIRVLSG
jgi:hypothetical protein